MSTFQPRPPYSDAELAALYPPQLQLQLVQILLRHGERTPVNARFSNTGLPPFWPYCRAVRHIKNAVLDPTAPSGGNDDSSSSRISTLEWKRRLESFGAGDAAVLAAGPRGELDDVCDMGMLTDRGRETTYFLGERLRHLYVDQLGFLPARIASPDFLYLRSTRIPRALESLQQAFQGLYPASARAPDFPPPTIISRPHADETLHPNDSHCRRFAALARAFGQRAADRWNDSPEMAYLNDRLGKWMPDDSPRIAVDSHPRLSGVMDTINATHAHGPETKLPAEFYDDKVRSIIDRIGVEEWYDGYKESREYRALGIGSLLGDVVSRMVGSAENTAVDGEYDLVRASGQSPTPIRFGLSGCHDTTLAGTLASLGAFDSRWPPFTSHIAIELFRHTAGSASAEQPRKSSPSPAQGSSQESIGRKPTNELSKHQKSKLDGYYVRLRYNDKPVTIPGCKPAGKHLEGDESFCTLATFKSIVDKFTPSDWKQQCRADPKAPAFPEKPEPSGY